MNALPTQAQYEMNEAKLLQAQLLRVEKAPLSERQEARTDYQDMMATTPNLIADRIGWILEGNYGFGAMKKAESILASRGNKIAQLSMLLASLEFSCPANFAAQAWNKLTLDQKLALEKAIQAVIAR